ncbi:F420-0:Gamma-glutamyl ligase [Anaerobranca californiensis DSM 14826]|jgi:GMP synthase PP-ATPase subunit|uniref:F420-0:Gamma-glutamyl ligase n=1 Tax=Anaerobranca californiensis DSM 14826 TaxID=1120989 RepID=A0A1M6NSF4_9FIRM|nr:coenzyme F420-0:L-glutamate ligase [Anaerobranca californiensis]SHJ98663.1 F420-0:Gamma-glutamyl ligase [Anaerobranca californiensis DSM 14826]
MLKPNEGKALYREVDGKNYARYAIKTHFITLGEDLDKIIEEYVIPHYQKGDIITLSEKIVALSQGDIIYKKDVKVTWLAKLLSKFVVKNQHCTGLRNVYKMQVAINIVGPVKILFAAIIAAIGKIFRIKGIFYKIIGNGISNLDGFNDEAYDYYADKGIFAPKNPERVCQRIKEKYDIDSMIVDANDLGVEILAFNKEIQDKGELVRKLLKDNPAGQDREQTPIILIREYAHREVSTSA